MYVTSHASRPWTSRRELAAGRVEASGTDFSHDREDGHVIDKYCVGEHMVEAHSQTRVSMQTHVMYEADMGAGSADDANDAGKEENEEHNHDDSWIGGGSRTSWGTRPASLGMRRPRALLA